MAKAQPFSVHGVEAWDSYLDLVTVNSSWVRLENMHAGFFNWILYAGHPHLLANLHHPTPI